MTLFLNLIRIGPPPNQAIFVSGFKLASFSIHANELAWHLPPSSSGLHEIFSIAPGRKIGFQWPRGKKESHAMNASAGWLASKTRVLSINDVCTMGEIISPK